MFLERFHESHPQATGPDCEVDPQRLQELLKVFHQFFPEQRIQELLDEINEMDYHQVIEPKPLSLEWPDSDAIVAQIESKFNDCTQASLLISIYKLFVFRFNLEEDSDAMKKINEILLRLEEERQEKDSEC